MQKIMSFERLQELLHKAHSYQMDFELGEMEYVLGLLLYTNLYVVPYAKLRAEMEGSFVKWEACPYFLILGVMLLGAYRMSLEEFSATVAGVLRQFIAFAGEYGYRRYLCKVVSRLYVEFAKEVGQENVGKCLYEIVTGQTANEVDFSKMKGFVN